jgi:hypothetical protein
LLCALHEVVNDNVFKMFLKFVRKQRFSWGGVSSGNLGK